MNKPMKQTKETQGDGKVPINKEAFKMLASEIGLNAACRKMGIPISTGKSWARRGGWNLPKRPGGRPQQAYQATSLHPVADALDATHQELENATKTGLKQTLAKAVQALAKQDALTVETIGQFKDACLAAAKLFGWDGKPAASVTVNSDKTVVVCTAEQRRAMIEARERFLNRRADIATDSPSADPAPGGELMNPATQPKLQPGTPIGRTQVPEDPQIAWLRSYGLSPEDEQEAMIPGGATFTPFWEPHAVSEADLYR